MIELPDSLELEAGLTLQLLTLSTTSAIPTTLDYDVSAGMHLVLVLSGKVDIQIGRAQALCYVSNPQQALVSLTLLAEANRLMCHLNANTSLRALHIAMRHDWLTRYTANRSPGYTHLLAQPDAMLLCHASARSLHFAEQLLAPVDSDNFLGHLHIKARVIELIGLVLSNASALQLNQRRPLKTLHQRDQLRMENLCKVLDSGTMDNASLAAIAEHVHLSVNTLQRHFNAVTGMTVKAYINASRLARAYYALTTQGVSVADAAHLAGYSNSANFATAFKRQYGIQPRQATPTLQHKTLSVWPRK